MSKNSYDHRSRNAIALSGNPNFFPEINIPRATAWMNNNHVKFLNDHVIIPRRYRHAGSYQLV
ncbi:MAG: hypothetical protein HQK53_04945 [Oligoflexia bacterium]|nr:hypothetical protein [Oligoflexia bacterium]